MRVGYIRVSTAEQNLARQEVLMEQLGVKKLFKEKLSAKDIERPIFEEMMAFVREGDVVVVESLSRFSRSTKDFLELIERLEEKGVGFVSQKEQFDTTSPQGVLVMTIFAALSEYEREMILQRQAEGIAIAKEAGKYKGRKPIETDWDAFGHEYDQIILGNSQAKFAQKNLGMKPATYFRRVHEYEQRVGIRDKDNKVIESAKAEYERRVKLEHEK